MKQKGKIPLIAAGLWFGSGSALISVAGSGSGSRRAKMTYKYRKK
jgi:hypothetical protein